MNIEKDYYTIMGINRDASEKDIKTAYRKLARKYHPDINKEPNAETLFKEMGAAYEVLKDPVKKAQYDQYLKNKEYSNQQNPYTKNADNVKEAKYYEDIFESLFGHMHAPKTPQKGHNYQTTLSISLEEAFNGTIKSIQIPIANQDSLKKMQTLHVKIPPQVKSGQQIKLTGQGAAGINGGPKGDLYITIELIKHPLFDVMDNDIYLTLPITPWEAALGTTVTVPTLSGKIDLKIAPGSQAGQKLRIKNKGLSGNPPGNQYILLKIITPPATSEAGKELYKKMAEIMPFNPREHMGRHHE